MNYRHQFHAGNFADVMKHALLVQLIRALQQKPKGFVYVDTHAGRGGYDLLAAERGDSLPRTPEWPQGIQRLWTDPPDAGPLAEYLALVREFNLRARRVAEELRRYPGSPWLAAALARPQDRLLLCERHPDEHASLAARFRGRPRVSVQEIDGYVGIRAALPPPERRALVLIDPPYEEQDERERILLAVREGLQRLPSAVFAVWYPLTGRASMGDVFGGTAPAAAPTLACELTVAGPGAGLRMPGCGVAVINPPWRFEDSAGPVLAALAPRLAQAPGGAGDVRWIVRPT